ncbi:hypothetical protein KGF51_09670 [Clostridioides sp. ZZV14-6045]|uniref:hypothetical protein n=1 Tax=Clostridioides sp. ZZV14-6045 TaxID=2811489 RepID=UPI001D10E7E4|nr:hypothetical protein [Clostridioides sp. ZZV14-6045]
MEQYEIDLGRVKNYPYCLKKIKKQTYEMCMVAVEKWGLAIQFVAWDDLNLPKEKLNKLCLKAVKKDGYALKHLNWDELNSKLSKKQIEKICIEAAKQNPWALKDVNEQTEKICIEAVKRNPWTLRDVKVQTDEICREAIKQDRFTIKDVNSKEKYLKEFNIKYLEAQGDVSEVIAINKNGQWLFAIDFEIDMIRKDFIDYIHEGAKDLNLEKGIDTYNQVYFDFLEQLN